MPLGFPPALPGSPPSWASASLRAELQPGSPQPAPGMWGSRPTLSAPNEADHPPPPSPAKGSAVRRREEPPWPLGAGSASPVSRPGVYLGRSGEAAFLMICLCPPWFGVRLDINSWNRRASILLGGEDSGLGALEWAAWASDRLRK